MTLSFGLIAISALLFLNLSGGSDAAACRHNGVTYQNGQEWRERENFIMRCDASDNGYWRTSVVACVLPFTGARIPVGSSVVHQRDTFKCEQNAQGSVVLVQEEDRNANCDGRPVGSRWQERTFELECMRGGYRRLVACIARNGERVPINGSKIIDGVRMECIKNPDGSVIYRGTATGGFQQQPVRGQRNDIN